MPKKSTELGALQVSRLLEPGFYFVGGVAGLALLVSTTKARSWILRATIGGKRRDMGLGGFPDVTLAGAREAARAAKVKISHGADPIRDAKVAKSELSASRARDQTFDECATAYIEAHEAGWKNEKHRKQWTATLNTYASPVIGKLYVRDIELVHILQILEPLWHTKTESATRLRGRIESVIDWATARGLRGGLNPARWKRHLELMFPSPKKIKKEEHYPAVQVTQIGAFMEQLRATPGVGARALEVLIYTVARSAGVLGMARPELDLHAKVWTIPGTRMKAGLEHRIPLSDAAVKIIDGQPETAGSDLVFGSPRGGELSNMTMSQLMKRMGFKDAKGKTCVPHGLRSTFRDWCAEYTNYPREVAEMALAHKIPDKVEAAYARSDLLDKRRRLIEEWAAFCGKPSAAQGKVVAIKRA